MPSDSFPILSQLLGPVGQSARGAKKAYDRLLKAHSAEELMDAWDDFVTKGKRVLEKSNETAKRSPNSKDWAKLLRGKYQGGDPGATYLWELRNAIDHGLSFPTEVTPAKINIGGVFSIGEGSHSNVYSYSTTDAYGNVHRSKTIVQDEKGEFHLVGPGFAPKIVSHPAGAVLVPVYSDVKKKTIDVPIAVGGHKVTEPTAKSFAAAALLFIDDILGELRVWFPNP